MFALKIYKTQMKKIFSTVVLSAFVLTFAFSAAVTVSAQTVAGAVYTRDLTLGSTGADVVSLQSFLESKGHLTIPAGTSKGYFGALTRAALAKYQTASMISPAAGYFGPLTRAKVTSDTGTTGTGTTTGTTTSDLNGDEASLESFDFSSGDDSDIEEGKTGDVAEIEFDVEDGDVMLDRVDLAFVNASTTDTTDVWDALESVELVIDGDVVGEADLSDEDEYLDEDDGTVRISGIKTKLEQGETAKIVVRVTVQDNVDTDDQDTFTVYVLDDGIRATDATGIQQYVGTDAEDVDFDVEAAGADAELKVSSSKEDPEATTLKVEDDAKSDMYSIFAFDLEAEEDDIEIDTVAINLQTGSSTAGTISDLVLEIDGEEFDDWSYTSGAAASTTREVTFDIDKDYTVDADSEVVVVLKAEFNSANGTNYSPGNTVRATISDSAVEGEGADDEISDGTANGETHTLAVEGIIVDEAGFSDEGSSANNDGNTSRDFTFTFEVTAFEEDFYIASSSVDIFIDGTATTTATSSYTVDSTGEEDATGVFTVEEGETETFTVVVTLDVATSGQYRVGLDSVLYTTNSNGTTGLLTKQLEDQDFRTAYSTINAN